MIIRHCQPLGSKYPTMSLPSGTQLLRRGHTILFVMYCGLLCLSLQHSMGTCPRSYMRSVNVMQCRVPLLHSSFLAGNDVTFDLWFGIFLPLSACLALRVTPRDAVKTGPLQTLHLKFLPTDSNHFFIGTNMVSIILSATVWCPFKSTLSRYLELIQLFCVILWRCINIISVQGLVNHGTSHGLKAPPKFYRFQEGGVRPVDVSSIHFSPFRQHLFLVRVHFFNIKRTFVVCFFQNRKSYMCCLHRNVEVQEQWPARV